MKYQLRKYCRKLANSIFVNVWKKYIISIRKPNKIKLKLILIKKTYKMVYAIKKKMIKKICGKKNSIQKEYNYKKSTKNM